MTKSISNRRLSIVTKSSNHLFIAVCIWLIGASQAQAATLLATGTLGGSSVGVNADLSGLTGNLENGLPNNILGGLGSGLTWAGGNTFIAVPDRGPNATAYNSAVDDTVSFISRLQTISMALTPNAPGSPQPFSLTPTLTNTTLLYSATPLTYGTGNGIGLGSGAPSVNAPNKFYFTGRSDNYDPAQNSGNPNNARFDPEAIRLSNDGTSAFISDEYGSYIYQFDRATGERIRTFTLPAKYYVNNLSPSGSTEISSNTSGRTANKGMEGLAITPDGKTLVAIVQASLIQDATPGGNSAKVLRMVTIDIATGATTHEYAYKLTTGSGVSDIVALNDHEFLVDERDGKGLGDGSSAAIKQVFKVDLTGAVDVSAMSGTQAFNNAVTKSSQPFLDLVNVLNSAPNNIAKNQIPSKIEGLAIGQDVNVNGVIQHTLWVANDNDFVPSSAGQNRFYVFGFTDTDLNGSTFAPQNVSVPEASSPSALLALGLLGLVCGLRQRAVNQKVL
jgi:hypothetical protein